MRNSILRSVASWSVLVFMVVLAGCGSSETASVHDPAVQQTVAKEAGVPLAQVQDAVAVGGHENAVNYGHGDGVIKLKNTWISQFRTEIQLHSVITN